MEPIAISSTNEYFVRAGKPFFYLADTVWSAFTNISFEEREEFLNYRKMQGFNVLQIDILPQWDRSQSDHDTLEPFHTTKSGFWDFTAPNEAYFKKAQQMAAMAAQKGFIPAFVVLWCNYVEGTWGAERLPGNQIPLEMIRPYVQYVARIFAEYQPIFLISGDTDFKTQTTRTCYLTALKAMKEVCPAALTTFHLNPPTDLPEELIEAAELDFYMYQSGHSIEEQANAYVLARRFAAKTVKRPVINGEPCYEGHGFGHQYGRFSAFHVRKAVWQSLLSGAKSGFTYGAHGVWSWHEPGKAFPGLAFSGEPYSWKTALHFEGAWDAGFIKWIFETYRLFDIEPDHVLLSSDTPEIRVAASPNKEKVVVYLPFNAEVELQCDFSSYQWAAFDLAARRVAIPDVRTGHGSTIFPLHCFNSDVLYLGNR